MNDLILKAIRELYALGATVNGDTILLSKNDKWVKPTTIELDEINAKVLELEWDNAKQIKLEEIVKANEIAGQLDINYMSTTFQADKYSQDLIVSVLSAGSVPSGFFWLDKSNNQVTMTYVELQGLSATILARGQTNFVKYQDLKTQINGIFISADGGLDGGYLTIDEARADLDKIVW